MAPAQRCLCEEGREARPGAPPLAVQLAVFYVFIGVGFLALYLTWRSNAK